MQLLDTYSSTLIDSFRHAMCPILDTLHTQHEYSRIEHQSMMDVVDTASSLQQGAIGFLHTNASYLKSVAQMSVNMHVQ